MRWHRSLKTLLPVRPIEKRKRPERRVLLQLEELETRALLSASSATPVPPATTAAKNEANPPPTTPATADATHPLLTVAHPKVSSQASPGVSGETPQQIQQIYGYNLLPSTIDGSGETIAIVDAFYDPSILSDANTFNSEFSLPQFNSTGGPTLTVVASGGGSASSLSQDSTGAWQLETSLDVEWAHAMAPGANILLVEAPDAGNDSMFGAVQWAASQPGVVAVSMSWGTNEFGGESAYDTSFIPPSSNPGVAFLAASGDSGAGAIYPAASPYVLSVGGTTLGTSTTGGGGTTGLGGGTTGFGTSGFGTSFGSLGSFGSGFSAFARAGGGLYRGAGSLTIAPTASPPGGGGPTDPYPGETGWYGSGGGPAAYEGYPSYQYNQPWIASTYGFPYNVEVTNQTTGVVTDYSARMTPDVAYNADPNTGYAVYDSIASADYGTVAGWNVIGGTSAASPQWAAIVALADQQRGNAGGTALDTNQVLNTLYNTLGSSPTNSVYTSVFHDITKGSNGYPAGPGYDLVTGLGTPVVNNLVPLLANTTIARGGLPTITGTGYGGSGGGFGSSGSTGFGGSSSFGSSGFFGFSASNQPGGGLFAGSGSLSIPPGSQGSNALNGPASGATAASATPQANAPQAPVAAVLTLTFSPAETAPASASTFVGNMSTLAPGSPSAAAGSTPLAASINAPASSANLLFGASGWNGADLSWRLSSLGLPSAQNEQPADDLSANTEEINDRSADDTLIEDGDTSGEDMAVLDLSAPSRQEEGDAGDGGDG